MGGGGEGVGGGEGSCDWACSSPALETLAGSPWTLPSPVLLSLREHTWGGYRGNAALGGATGCTLLALAWVTLQALAQAPGKWGGEGHSCPHPRCKMSPHSVNMGLMGIRMPPTPNPVQSFKAEGRHFGDKSRERGGRRASPTLVMF